MRSNTASSYDMPLVAWPRCLLCNAPRHVVPRERWPNQEPHHMKPDHAGDVVLECGNGHLWLVGAAQ